MTKNFRKLLLSELHMAVFNPGEKKALTDSSLTEAITANENLHAYGYTLKPEGIIALALSGESDSFYNSFKELVPDVKAQPMYPDFPKQVMEISEAEFRLHQCMHYFSTYGLEYLTGAEVSKGWLPDVQSTPKTESDTILLEAQVLDLVPEDMAYAEALSTILKKRERPTLPEEEMILEAAEHVTAGELADVKVAFKENLLFVFGLLVEKSNREICLRTLSCLCAHTGDVLKCVHAYQKDNKYHLRTSEKKLFVRLLESYPVSDFEENLMRSNAQREKNLVVLAHLDYASYSHSPAHLESVRKLRDHELLSWDGKVEALLKAEDPSALSFISKRPGMLLRKLNRLIELGYTEEELTEALCAYAKKLSPHTLIKAAKSFSLDRLAIERKYQHALVQLTQNYNSNWNNALWHCEYTFSLKKRELSPACIDARMNKEIADATEELGLNSIPGEKKSLERKITLLEDRKKMVKFLSTENSLRQSNSSKLVDWELVNAWLIAQNQDSMEENFAQIDAEISSLHQELSLLDIRKQELLTRLSEITHDIEERYLTERMECRAKLELLEEQEAEEITRINDRYRGEMEQSEVYREAINEIESEHNRSLIRLKNSESIKRILSKALCCHYSSVSTALKGKKVYLDMDCFDLTHSELNLNARSDEGGYYRSGIAFKIPKEAHTVRFFTYWNDSQRVDVDLHGYGYNTNGDAINIGWDRDFRESGVVFSGDITHSDAAEYIDIDMNAPISHIYANVNLFSGKSDLSWIRECYVGLMAVDKLHENIKLYNPANCFFTHEIRQRTRALYYGYVDVQNRYVKFIGAPNSSYSNYSKPYINPECDYSIEDHLKILFEAQQVQPVQSKEDAEVILTMGKSSDPRSISLVDSNFFLEF